MREFVAAMEKSHWDEKDKFYHGLDAMGYSDQLKKAGDWHVDEFHGDLARKELKLSSDEQAFDKLKGPA